MMERFTLIQKSMKIIRVDTGDSDWITEYYDNQGIGDKIQYMIRFAVRNIKQLNSGIVFRDGKCIFQWKKQNVRNI